MENVIETALIRVPVSKLAISPLNVRKKQGKALRAGCADCRARTDTQPRCH